MLELVIIVDSSGSIGRANFNKYVRPFVRDLVRGFDIGPEATQVGLIVYSKDVDVVFGLNNTHNNVKVGLDDMTRDGYR